MTSMLGRVQSAVCSSRQQRVATPHAADLDATCTRRVSAPQDETVSQDIITRREDGPRVGL